jgi:hypothetical protein
VKTIFLCLSFAAASALAQAVAPAIEDEEHECRVHRVEEDVGDDSAH